MKIFYIGIVLFGVAGFSASAQTGAERRPASPAVENQGKVSGEKKETWSTSSGERRRATPSDTVPETAKPLPAGSASDKRKAE